MDILIAPNAFKHSLAADKVAWAIREGLLRSKLKGHFECCPIGDGGDGTGHLIIQKHNGAIVSVAVHDPLGKKIQASFGLIENGLTAVIEMAAASGLHLLKTEEHNPLKATSFGTGEQIVHALSRGVRKVIITMGGSATVDGGMGILKALGIRFLNEMGNELHTPGELVSLFAIDSSGIDKRIKKCELVILCDVDNKLLGKQGAAFVFGPQKGASPSDVEVLNKALSKFAEVVLKETSFDINSFQFGGTAGGAAAGLAGILDAKLVSGIDYFFQLTDFDMSLKDCDLVITGEGGTDEQTLNGKGPFGVACRARNLGIPVICLSGKVPLKEVKGLSEYFDALIPIGNEPLQMEESFALTQDNLIRTGMLVGKLLALGEFKRT
ncbi:MAG: glycerate kinase [Bacteroidetes bacterium]|nr:glycerate kinase [Bacteroidota bacterium]